MPSGSGFYFYTMRLFTLALLLISTRLFSQQTIVSTATQLIVDKQYEQANRYLDSILHKDKKNVDALMMKGNVILNRDLANTPSLTLITKEEESIFNNQLGFIEHPVKVVSDTTLQQVESLWLQCLKTDSSRIDILKGLCTLYGMALKKEKLKAAIKKLVQQEKDEDGGQAYRTAEYARKFKERGRVEEAMELYRFIATLYPQLAGIRCDIASEYFYSGDIKSALQWLDSAFAQKDIDETTYLNGAFIYSNLGYFDNAQQTLDSYSKKFDRKMNQFYYGLHQFAEATKGWYDVLQYFSQMVDSNAYYTEVKLAQTLLQYKDSFSIADYSALIRTDIPDYYKVLIHQRAVKQFPQSCEPFLQYGVFESFIKNYPAAIQFLEEGEHCNMDSSQLAYWQLNYGFALYQSGQYKSSLLRWQPLLRSGNKFMAQAAEYFTAKILLEQKQNQLAKTYLEKISASDTDTKYVTLANYLLQH